MKPLTILTPKNIKFEWNDVEQKYFDEVKQIVAYINLLYYNGFNKKFGMHMDASNFQLVPVILHYDIPIEFYSKKLTTPQKIYMVT